MKKLLVSFFALVLLAGCGSSSSDNKTESKTCTQEQNGAKMSAKLDAKDDKVVKTTVEVSLDVPATTDLTKLTEDQKKAMSDATLAQLGISEGTGVKVTVGFEGKQIKVSIAVDNEKADATTLTKLGLNSDKGMKLSEMVKSAEASGATCK